MTRYLTRPTTQGSVTDVAVEDGTVRDDLPLPSAFDDALSSQAERRREARVATKLSPQAAALLPLMMSMARLQARLTHAERGR
jgi:hypothetical protein